MYRDIIYLNQYHIYIYILNMISIYSYRAYIHKHMIYMVYDIYGIWYIWYMIYIYIYISVFLPPVRLINFFGSVRQNVITASILFLRNEASWRPRRTLVLSFWCWNHRIFSQQWNWQRISLQPHSSRIVPSLTYSASTFKLESVYSVKRISHSTLKVSCEGWHPQLSLPLSAYYPLPSCKPLGND